MSLEQNKKTVLAFLGSLARGQPDEALLCDAAAWWIPGSGVIDREAFLALSARVHQRFSGPGRLEPTAVTAEEDRVAVEANGRFELKDGRVYENTYHFLFRLRDGLICESREHNNTAIPAALFSAASERRADK
jgi:ketosteroid isomerase-like protein